MSDLKALLERADRAVSGVPLQDGGLTGLQRRRDRKRRNERITASVVGIAVFVAAVWIVTSVGSFDRTTTPADQSTVNPADASAEKVALRFLDALAAYDADRAINYLADDADLSGLFGLEGTREFRLLIRFWEATGFQHILDSCEETISLPSATVVRCTYDFHGLRSDEIGRGPYSGNYDEITVRDGEIVDVSSYFDITEFSFQIWEPFAGWVVTNYPEDVAVMYETLSGPQLTRESIRLWEQHTREYVKAVQQGTA